MAALSPDEIELQINKLIPKQKGKRTRSQIGKGSKSKGKSGERNIVDFLKELTNLSWIRVPNSGAFSGGKNRERAKWLAQDQLVASCADIFPPDALFYQFIIESKFYKKFSFNKVFKKKTFNAQLDKWCKELLYDCMTYAMYSKSDKQMLPLLWIKINNSGEFILYNRGYFNKLFNTQLEIEECCPYYLEQDYQDIDQLKLLGFDDKWIFLKARDFITKNKEILFKIQEI